MKPYIRRPINHIDDKMITEKLNKKLNEQPQLQLSGHKDD